MIAEASATAFKKECDENTCTVYFTMHGRYDYQLLVTPMTSHILIKYKTMEYKILRHDKEAYESTVAFLSEVISSEVDVYLNDDIEYNGYCPDHDENFNVNILKVARHGKQVFCIPAFKKEDMAETLKFYMKSLRYLN